MIVEGRYRIRRWIGPRKESGAYPKLYYLAGIMREEAAEKQARGTGILENRDVLILVCGRGPEVVALSAVQRERLREFAARRSIDNASPHLLPVLHLGELPTLGSSYLVMPQLRNTLQALVDPGPLPPPDEALALILRDAGRSVRGRGEPARLCPRQPVAYILACTSPRGVAAESPPP